MSLVDALAGRLVVPLPEGGRLFYNLGRDASYAAAERGEIPCRTVGRRKVMPVHLALKDQGMSDELIARVLLGAPKNAEAGPASPATDTHIAPMEDDSDDSAPGDRANTNIHPIRGR